MRQDVENVESSCLDRPIIILGAPCSGTTFLGESLSRHPTLAFADEPRLVWRYGNDHKSDMFSPQDARDEVRRHIRSYFTKFVREAGAQRLLEKTPSNSLRPEFVETVLPECRFLHITRSPIDTVLSIHSNWLNRTYGTKGIRAGRVRKRMEEITPRQFRFYAREAVFRLAPVRLARLLGPNVWGPRIPGINGMLRDLDMLDVSALQWRMCVELALHCGRRLPPHRYLEIRLEDLSSPEVLRRLFDFCELDGHGEVLRNFEQTHQPDLARSRYADARVEDIERILRWIEPTIRLLDYDL